MDTDKSILLQKTVRDNNEDLMNFMRDMKHWETDMKRKDAELSSQKVPDECIPPVRSKRRLKEKKLKVEVYVEKSKQEKPKKKLSGFDYSAWDKFDVEKACEEVDKPNSNVSYESDSEVDSESENEEDKLRQQAMYEKELGNKYVKKEKWKEGIEQYTKAIKCFDKDAIFYANRALCYLKTNQFKSAEEDCTKSLELDSQYVKAYLRRAAARMSLKKYKDAQSDLNSVLKLEPNNLQARKDLEKLNAERSNNVKVDNTTTKEKSVVVKATSPLKASSEEDNVNKLKSLPNKTSAFKNDNNGDDYPWGVIDPKRVIKAVHKPPHMRSKKPLRRIEIVDMNDSATKSQVNLNGPSNVNDSSLKVIPNCNENKKVEGVVNVTNVINKEVVTNTVNSSRNVDKDIENINNITKENYKLILNNDEKISSTSHDNNTEIPPPPKTSVQFNLAWKKLKHNSNLLYLYLKKIDGRNFSSIFQDSLESDAFSGIVTTLCTEFIKHQTPVLSYLKGLTTIRRFEMLVLFMSKQDKEGLKQLIDYCISTNETTSDNANILKKQFQLDY